MHLMKKHHGPQGVLNLLSNEHRKCWEPLECLKLIKECLKDSHPSISHQFPFVVDSTTDKHMTYSELCKHLHNVAKGFSTMEAKNFLNSIIKSGNKNYVGKSTARMMIWVCVYYEFYCNKNQSIKLLEFFEEMQRSLNISTERFHLLQCFLNPESMIKMEEVPNPLNPNAEVLECTDDGKIKRKQPPSNVPKVDPIWEFFYPSDGHQDPFDVDLRHALANMIAVVFGLPDHSTHLWYHMFSPGELENSYLTGFMYNKVVKTGALMYDCGCELNEDGYYGRSDYNFRDSFSLHSWYLLLWCNFGAFCVGLLTQQKAHKQLKGHILSDWMSIRDYCMTQLRTIWFHMRTNMSFGDEERSFFIMSSMYQLFMLFQDKDIPSSNGKFVDLNALINYEKYWHKHVYEFSKTDLKYKLQNRSSHSVWTLPIVKSLRMLEQSYPYPATENDYMNSLVNATEKNSCSSTHLLALNLLTLERKKLQAGGTLLPDLIEFYRWIHSQLSHLVTYERAKEITIGQVINLTAKRYSPEICEHLTNLFKRVNNKYNDYLKVNGGVIGNVTCNRVINPTDVSCITKDTPLIKLVSFEDTNKNDWLYIVLMDIIENHNSFLNSIYTHTISADCHYKKYLPDNPSELHPTEVTSQACIIPSDGPNEKQFLKLINSHYVYNGTQSAAVFDLDQLELDVVKVYIVGKPLITIDSNIRTVFRFRNSPTEATLPKYNPGCAIDLSAIAQELPDDYKISLRKQTKKVLEFNFRTASYHTFTEIINGLRMVIGYLRQNILQKKSKELDTILVDYLETFLKKSFVEIGIQSISETQCKLLGDIEMKKLFKCLGLFVGWLQGGLYDFGSLPISVFTHLEYADMDTIMKTCSTISTTDLENLLTDLDEFEKSLNHAETHLTTKEECKKPIIQCLIDLGFCESTDKFVSLIPKSILVCHYVHFRMTLRKLKIKVEEMTRSQAQNTPKEEEKWTEIIEDLWKVHLPHFQDEVKVYDDNCLKLDCVTLQYGDDEESESDSEPWLDQDIEDSTEDTRETKETEKEIIQKIKDDPKLKEVVMKTLVSPQAPITPSLLTAPPSDKAKNMTLEEICQWLKEKNIADEYIECFKKDDIDGSVLAEYDDDDLKGMGISEPHIRKKIRIQFRKIK